jgi:hypothetical protein
MANLLRFIDIGDYHDPEFKGPRITDFREWSELARRLTIPYYEEARLYWANANEDGYFDGVNENRIYMEDFLKRLVKKYAKNNP